MTLSFPNVQMILEGNCCVLNFPKNNEIIVRISALASEMGQIGKISVYNMISYIITNNHDNVSIIF